MLAEHASLPQDIAGISQEKAPWHCHGLAFRMATYSGENENLFARWNKLLKLPNGRCGWCQELSQWNSEGDHWAKKWDKFYEFLWLLQCIEYFMDAGHGVSFPMNKQTAAPDIKVTRRDGETVYAECTVFSKWWFNEIFLEDLLGLVDPHLSIRRTHNIARNNANNPFSSSNFAETLKQVTESLAPHILATTKTEAAKVSPCSLWKRAGFQIILKGDGEYQADPNNAHGIASHSLPVFLGEIIKAKEKSNNLVDSRPNILLVNGLGVDFQFIMFDKQQALDEFNNDAIDEIWIAACGIDEELRATERIQKFMRHGHASSGL